MLCPALQLHASSCVDVTEQLALQLSSFAGYSGHSEALTVPLLACHALEVCDQLCLRVNSITSYMDVNRLVSWLPYVVYSLYTVHSFPSVVSSLN